MFVGGHHQNMQPYFGGKWRVHIEKQYTQDLVDKIKKNVRDDKVHMAIMEEPTMSSTKQDLLRRSFLESRDKPVRRMQLFPWQVLCVLTREDVDDAEPLDRAVNAFNQRERERRQTEIRDVLQRYQALNREMHNLEKSKNHSPLLKDEERRLENLEREKEEIEITWWPIPEEYPSEVSALPCAKVRDGFILLGPLGRNFNFETGEFLRRRK